MTEANAATVANDATAVAARLDEYARRLRAGLSVVEALDLIMAWAMKERARRAA